MLTIACCRIINTVMSDIRAGVQSHWGASGLSVLLKNFPDCASWTSTEKAHYIDIDQQAACLIGFDQEYLQLSRGRYNGWFKTVLLGSEIGLFFESFDQVLDQWGACPKDQHGFIFLMEGSPDILLNGNPFDPDCIMYTAPGSGFDCNSGPGTKFGVISVSTEAFELFLAASQQNENWDNTLMPPSQLIRSAIRAQTLRQMTRQGLQLADEASTPSPAEGALAGFETSLISLLISFVLSAKDSGSFENRRQASIRNRAAFQARAFVHEMGATNVSVVDLVHYLGTSRRKLEYDFRNHFGIGPAEYIRVIKLNEFRSALLHESNHDRSIGDIAAGLGIWHLSRLAQYYQIQFGELPSQTRCL
ncbi:transcriptional regulator EutR [Marinomonas gallaica]|uniref:Transcriptional regulator EutR n=1 Tax=Marinomonas gallaica TaxID=1806667 RepID=A0A1C3JS11_9GAMM|nr:transcriptional regulator EutR [Marinomonas gallaica]SBT19871.1 transcriptional regulator EutR [Marinomonas gallaica]